MLACRWLRAGAVCAGRAGGLRRTVIQKKEEYSTQNEDVLVKYVSCLYCGDPAKLQIQIFPTNTAAEISRKAVSFRSVLRSNSNWLLLSEKLIPLRNGLEVLNYKLFPWGCRRFVTDGIAWGSR